MNKILIVSDDAQEYLSLKGLLENSGFQTALFPTAMEPSSLTAFSPGLVAIDVSTAREHSRQKMLLLRSRFTNTPILGMFDRTSSVQDIAYFQTDDFVFKPFQLEELMVRMRRLLLERLVKHHDYPLVERRRHERRRNLTRTSVTNSKKLKPIFRIDSWSRQIFLHDQPCQLSPKEYALFCLLASYPGRVFTDEEIIPRLWPGNRRAADSDVEQFIHRLRKKLKEEPFQPRWILTVKGFGYKLDDSGVL